MEGSLTIVSAIIGLSTVVAAFYGNRFRKHRHAQKMRLRGHKEYNRDRPTLIVDRSVVTAKDAATP